MFNLILWKFDNQYWLESYKKTNERSNQACLLVYNYYLRVAIDSAATVSTYDLIMGSIVYRQLLRQYQYLVKDVSTNWIANFFHELLRFTNQD